MDTLQKICKKIDTEQKNYNNEVECVKKIVNDYVNNDNNKLLRLKAQIRKRDNGVNNFTAVSLLVSMYAFLLTIIHNTEQGVMVYQVCAGLCLFLIMFFMLYTTLYKKKNATQKWIKYVEVVLEQM